MASIFVGAELIYSTPDLVRVYQDVYLSLWSASAFYTAQWRFESVKKPKTFRFQLVEADSAYDFLPWGSDRLAFDTIEYAGWYTWGGGVPPFNLRPWAIVRSDVPGTLRVRAAWA